MYIHLTHDVALLSRSHCEWNNIDDSITVPVSYEWLNNDSNNESLFTNDNVINNKYNEVSNDFKRESKEENIFGKDIKEKIEVTPETTKSFTT